MSEIETLFRHCLISLIAIASHDESPFTYEDETLSAPQYRELMKELEVMRDHILITVYNDGEDAISLDDFSAPLLQEAQQTFVKCIKKFVYARYQ